MPALQRSAPAAPAAPAAPLSAATRGPSAIPTRGIESEWNSVYQRFSDWSADGTWARVLATVQASSAAAGDVDWTVSVDSTITRVQQYGATLTRGTGGRIELQGARPAGAA